MNAQANRNFACPNYDACLDMAVKAKMKDFQCEGCPQQQAVRPDWEMIQEQDAQRMLTLFEAVCRRQSRTSSKPLTPEDLAFLWEDEVPAADALG